MLISEFGKGWETNFKRPCPGSPFFWADPGIAELDPQRKDAKEFAINFRPVIKSLWLRTCHQERACRRGICFRVPESNILACVRALGV
jgi:hypothetical protein